MNEFDSGARGVPGRKRIWAGRIITGAVAVFLAFDATIKLLRVQAVMDGFEQMGFPPSLVVPIGCLLLACLIVYLVPRTAFLGAILLTGYLGGAVASQLRVEAPLLGFTLFPIYVAAFAWLGLYLRDDDLRTFVRTRISGG